MKFNLGDTIFWVESSCNAQKKVPCPMCFGQRVVTLILGDGSTEGIECGFCGHGLEGPSGVATVWEPNAWIKSGVVTGLSTKNGNRYEVNHSTVEESDAFATQTQAEMERARRYELEVERSKEWFKSSFINCKAKQVWSAGYHKGCIKSAERSIEWHRLRLAMINEKSE